MSDNVCLSVTRTYPSNNDHSRAGVSSCPHDESGTKTYPVIRAIHARRGEHRGAEKGHISMTHTGTTPVRHGTVVEGFIDGLAQEGRN